MSSRKALDLSSLASGLELGPGFVLESASRKSTEEYRKVLQELDQESLHRDESARVQVGDQVRFLGGWLYDSAVLSMERSRCGFRLTLSEDWAGELAGWYAVRTRHPKYSRCQTILPVQLEFSGVSEVVCRRVDFDHDARLLPADCGKVFKAAQEYLWTEVIYASADRIQMALNVWSWHIVRDFPYIAVLVDAKRPRIKDLRHRNWERMFGPDSLAIFDEAEKLRAEDPRQIQGNVKIEAFLDRMGVPPGKFPIDRKRPKREARFRRRGLIYRSFE